MLIYQTFVWSDFNKQNILNFWPRATQPFQKFHAKKGHTQWDHIWKKVKGYSNNKWHFLALFQQSIPHVPFNFSQSLFLDSHNIWTVNLVSKEIYYKAFQKHKSIKNNIWKVHVTLCRPCLPPPPLSVTCDLNGPLPKFLAENIIGNFLWMICHNETNEVHNYCCSMFMLNFVINIIY